jgi:hypothetical protein
LLVAAVEVDMVLVVGEVLLTIFHQYLMLNRDQVEQSPQEQYQYQLQTVELVEQQVVLVGDGHKQMRVELLALHFQVVRKVQVVVDMVLVMVRVVDLLMVVLVQVLMDLVAVVDMVQDLKTQDQEMEMVVMVVMVLDLMEALHLAAAVEVLEAMELM